jgi:hypothetical protein
VTLLLAACDSTAPRPMQRLNLSATIGPRTSLSGPFADVIVTGSGGTVRITSAQVTLSHLDLTSDAVCSADTDDEANDVDDGNEPADSAEHADTTEAEGDNNDEHDCEVQVDPVRVDLPLDGTTKVILDALVPVGTYAGLRARLEDVKVVGVFTDPGGADHPFTFTSEAEAELAVDFPSPVTVGAGTNNLTIDADVASWFKDLSGAVLDPTNAANREAIEHSIRASLRAFEDDDHDGHNDHEEAGEDGH